MDDNEIRSCLPAAYGDNSAHLAMRHADLVSVVGQAARWAGAFRVQTDALSVDGSAYTSRPLEPYAVDLNRIHSMLWVLRVSLIGAMNQCFEANAPTAPPPLPPPCKAGATLIPEHLVEYCPTYAEGGTYVLSLQSTSRYCATPQQYWWEAVVNVERHLSEGGARSVDLMSYATVVRGLWDQASLLVRKAYQDAVAATYGHIWVTRYPADDARALILWMRELTEVGFDDTECESVLRGLEGAFPEAVARCRAAGDRWQRSAPSDR
jgi:hypothetical protein